MTQKKIDPLVLAFQKDLNTFKFNARKIKALPDEKYYADLCDTFNKHQIAIGEKHPKTCQNGLVRLLMIVAKHRPVLFEKSFESISWRGFKFEAKHKIEQNPPF